MTPERWFVRELAAFDPNLLAVWDEKKQRWVIREWDVQHGRDARTREGWMRKSSLVMTICYRDDRYHDIGYKPLDQRALDAVRIARFYSENEEVAAKEVDDNNERIERSLDADKELAAKDASIDAYRHFRTHTVGV